MSVGDAGSAGYRIRSDGVDFRKWGFQMSQKMLMAAVVVATLTLGQATQAAQSGDMAVSAGNNSATESGARNVSLGVRAGTQGLGGELAYHFTPRLALRLAGQAFSVDYDETDDGIDYKGKANLQSFGLLLDVHPFAGRFFLSGGLYANGNKAHLKASDPTGTEEYELGDEDYTSDPDDPLTLSAKLDYPSVAPYLGLGWGNSAQGNSRWFGRFELGVMFHGSGNLDMTSSGSAVDSSGQSFDTQGNSDVAVEFRENLEKERKDLEDQINDLSVYPVVALSLGFRF